MRLYQREKGRLIEEGGGDIEGRREGRLRRSAVVSKVKGKVD